MIYSPIIVPTLNRREHLGKLLDSIKINGWASKTQLIISVDYPPSEKYVRGYEKVCSYLKQNYAELSMTLDKVDIIYQDHNLGPLENYYFLVKYIENKGFDRFIFSEDDNIFAQNTIEYIDKMLEHFESDSTIEAICTNGASSVEGNRSNVVKTDNFSAQVYGGWCENFNFWRKIINRNYMYTLWKDKRFVRELLRINVGAFFSFKSALLRDQILYITNNGEPPVIDQMLKLYLIKEKKYVLCSAIGESYNIGYDGSGVNCPKVDNMEHSEQSMDEHFELIVDGDVPIYVTKSVISVKNWIQILGCLLKINYYVWRHPHPY